MKYVLQVTNLYDQKVYWTGIYDAPYTQDIDYAKQYNDREAVLVDMEKWFGEYSLHKMITVLPIKIIICKEETNRVKKTNNKKEHKT